MTRTIRSRRRYWSLLTVGALLFLVGTAGAATVPQDDILIILDQSKSMKETTPGQSGNYESDPWQAIKSRGALEALRYVADHILQDGDYFALISFGSNARRILSQEVNYPHERELLKQKIAQLAFEDKRTDIPAGIKNATDLLVDMNTPDRRKIMIMITDGVNEPPDDSPYFTPEAQEQVYRELRDLIAANNWDLSLVGIGEYTKENIHEIADKLGLPLSKALVFDNPQDSEEIKNKLTGVIQRERDARVTMEAKPLIIRLRPQLFGGYTTGRETLMLTSTFAEEVEVHLNPQNPVSLDDGEGVRATVVPLKLTLTPNQPTPFTLTFGFEGDRPTSGNQRGTLALHVGPSSPRQFFPRETEFEVILPSWWDVYGLYVALAIAAALILLGLLIWLMRKAQVPEVRITVNAGDKALGEVTTLRKKEKLLIANGLPAGKFVSAKGLSCTTAAEITYLGHNKFTVQGVEASIVTEDRKTVQQLQVGLDTYFDLKDNDGHLLRSVAISAPGKGGDPFGGGSGYDAGPF